MGGHVGCSGPPPVRWRPRSHCPRHHGRPAPLQPGVSRGRQGIYGTSLCLARWMGQAECADLLPRRHRGLRVVPSRPFHGRVGTPGPPRACPVCSPCPCPRQGGTLSVFLGRPEGTGSEGQGSPQGHRACQEGSDPMSSPSHRAWSALGSYTGRSSGRARGPPAAPGVP